MEELNKVSIIMSAYNAEDTIGKGIQSVLDQTYKNIELVIVDDCSTDSTSTIVQSFGNPIIKYIRNEENLGAGWARDIGIKNSTGNWIGFLDSDDWIEPDFVETLLNKALLDDADFIGGGYIRVEGDTEEIFMPGHEMVLENEDKWIITDKKDIIYKFLNSTLSKKEIWDNFDYSHLRFQEDVTSLNLLVYYSKRRTFVKYAGYYYWQNPKSLCHQASQVKVLIYNILANIELDKYSEKTDMPKYYGLLVRQGFSQLIAYVAKNKCVEELDLYTKELGDILLYLIAHYNFKI